ncbi:hypothetical protein Syun_027085 [Stephania yunnanensis]|uniref:Uncharacterized protein n=1 Tax=Stephania yunnanensis TaxID=152371 RepID=A0AAP0HMF8_9MAGN
MVVSLVMVERRVRPWWPNPLSHGDGGVPPRHRFHHGWGGEPPQPEKNEEQKKKKKKNGFGKKKKNREKEVRETTHTRACASLLGSLGEPGPQGSATPAGPGRSGPGDSDQPDGSGPTRLNPNGKNEEEKKKKKKRRKRKGKIMENFGKKSEKLWPKKWELRISNLP